MGSLNCQARRKENGEILQLNLIEENKEEKNTRYNKIKTEVQIYQES